MENFHRKKARANSGISVFEIVATFSIVFIFLTTVINSVGAARARGLEAERKAALSQLKVYLELYRDQNGHYPYTGQTFSSEPADIFDNNSGNWIPGLAPGYMGTLPRDPRGKDSTNPTCNGWGKEAYWYYSNGTDYILRSVCWSTGSWGTDDIFYDEIYPDWSYKVCTPGLCGFSY